MSLSKDLTDSFKERMAQNHDDMDITFSIMVLGTNFWPLNPPSHDFVIPVEVLSTYDRFQKYYQTKHSGRKLTWLWNYSKNELRTNYLNQKYILMTSSYQMAVLLQYNQNDTMSLDELVAATSISKDILSQVLAVLVKAKILINDEKEQYDLNPSKNKKYTILFVYENSSPFGLDFKSKKIRVNLNLPIKAEVKAESADVLKAVDEDRKYVIQATIVRYVTFSFFPVLRVWPYFFYYFRIMKARKTMKNQALIQEVISQISQRFAPNIPDIKKVRIISSPSSYSLNLSWSLVSSGNWNPPWERIHGACRWLKGYICLHRLKFPALWSKYIPYFPWYTYFSSAQSISAHIINTSCNLD